MLLFIRVFYFKKPTLLFRVPTAPGKPGNFGTDFPVMENHGTFVSAEKWEERECTLVV